MNSIESVIALFYGPFKSAYFSIVLYFGPNLQATPTFSKFQFFQKWSMPYRLSVVKVKTFYTSLKLAQLPLENHKNIEKCDILRGAHPPASNFQNFIFGESVVFYVYFLDINRKYLEIRLYGRNRGWKCHFDMVFKIFGPQGRTKEDL